MLYMSAYLGLASMVAVGRWVGLLAPSNNEDMLRTPLHPKAPSVLAQSTPASGPNPAPAVAVEVPEPRSPLRSSHPALALDGTSTPNNPSQQLALPSGTNSLQQPATPKPAKDGYTLDHNAARHTPFTRDEPLAPQGKELQVQPEQTDGLKGSVNGLEEALEEVTENAKTAGTTAVEAPQHVKTFSGGRGSTTANQRKPAAGHFLGVGKTLHTRPLPTSCGNAMASPE